jgi:beta-apo-4'-carotenal oxygenase
MIYLTMNDLPQFTHTPVDSIKGVHDRVKNQFHSHATRTLEYRLKQLRSLYWD